MRQGSASIIYNIRKVVQLLGWIYSYLRIFIIQLTCNSSMRSRTGRRKGVICRRIGIQALGGGFQRYNHLYQIKRCNCPSDFVTQHHTRLVVGWPFPSLQLSLSGCYNAGILHYFFNIWRLPNHIDFNSLHCISFRYNITNAWKQNNIKYNMMFIIQFLKLLKSINSRRYVISIRCIK